MNTVAELTEYGLNEKVASAMLASYRKHIGERHGCNTVTDIHYIGVGTRRIELTCELCGAKYYKDFRNSANRWSELRRTCSCQVQPKESLPKAGVVRNDDQSYIGKIYGDYEVLNHYKIPHKDRAGSIVIWVCKCTHCGDVKKLQPSAVKRGKQCACQRSAEHDAVWAGRIGQRYGRLVITGFEHKISGKNKKTFAKCNCDCGGSVMAQYSSLVYGQTKSCGCLAEEFIKKAKDGRSVARSRSPLYSTWYGMNYRCYNHKSSSYKDYGGRGIRVCDEWLGHDGFDRFEKWSYENGYAPESGLSLDRIDVNGNYEPGNCRYTTVYVQAVNQRPPKRRPVKTYIIDGAEKTLKGWCDEYHISVQAVKYRCETIGMSLEDALKTPKTRKGNIFAGEQARKRAGVLNKCESYIEANLYLAAIRSSISLIPQYRVGKYRADFLVEDTNILIECDGYDSHKTKEQLKNDCLRDRELIKHGYMVIRFAGSEINEDPDACCKEIMEMVNVYHAETNYTGRATNTG